MVEKKCSKCKGTGNGIPYHSSHSYGDCGTCGGSGVVIVAENTLT